jgi:hypothetical protein
VGKDQEVQKQELREVFRKKTSVFTKSRREISIQIIGSGRARGRDPHILEEEPFKKSQEEKIRRDGS